MTPADLDRAVVAAVCAATAAGELAGRIPVTAALTWENGRFVTPLPLRMAAAAGERPQRVAEIIARRLGGVGEVAVTGPGFLAIAPRDIGALAGHIVETRDYGYAEGLAGAETWPDRPRTFGNPGFVVRFAYVRATSVRRQAGDLGFAAGDPAGWLDAPAERRLLGLLSDLPPRVVARYRRQLVLVADAYHDVHERCPALPKGDEPPTARHAARVTLAEAVRIALNNGLRTLGETPEERL